MALTTAQIQQAYVTFFSRPADAAGLNYWSSYNGSVADLYATFAQQAEYTAAFNGLSSSQKVNVVYQNLFGRDAEPTGLLYWAKALDAGSVTVANLALAVSAGAQGADGTTVTNRVTAATAFTAALDTTAEILGYSGATANAAAKTWLSAVKDTAASLTAATAGVDAAVTSTVSVGGAAGSTFTLTTGVDTIAGTTGNDTFAVTDSTLTLGDTISAGAGTDTLNLMAANAVTTALPLGATVTGIENFNIVGAAAVTANTSTIAGVTSASVTNSGANNISLTGSATQDLAATNGTLAAGTVTVNGGKNVTVSTGELTASGGTGGALSIGATTAAAGTVTVTQAATSGNVTANSTATAGAIGVTGGTSINITQTIAPTAAAATTVLTGSLAAVTNTGGAITVTGNASTKDVTVTQSAAVSAVNSATIGRIGIVAGAVDVLDANRASTTAAGTIETVTLTNAGAATVNSGALKTLNLGGTLVTVDAGTSGALTTPANTTIAVNLNGAVSTGAVTVDSDFTTLNLSGNTTASTLASLVASGATTINVSGDAKVTLTANTTGAVTAINVTNTKGAGFGTAIAAGVTFTGGAGDDSVVLSTGFTKANTMGAGNDTVTYGGAASTTAGSVGSMAAGEGTDTIIMTDAQAAAADGSSAFNTAFTGFEVLRVSDAFVEDALDLDGINAVSKVILAAGVSGTAAMSNLANNGTVQINADGAATPALTIGVKSAVANASDVLNLTLSKTGGVLAAGSVTAANVERINITTPDAAVAPALGSDAAIHTLTLVATGATTVTVAGNNGLTLTNTGNAAITTFDASGVVANNTAASTYVAATTDTAANLAVTFASKNATANAAVTITGGAGADVLTGSDQAVNVDTITGGEGADTITGGTGNDVIILTETTAAIDTVKLTATATNGVDTIRGFAPGTGIDVVDLIDGQTTVATADAATAVFASTSGAALTTGASAFVLTGIATTTTLTDVVEITTTLSSYGNLGLSGATSGTELLKALSSTDTASTGITLATASDDFYLVAYQGGNAYLYAVTDSGDTNATAAEIALVGVFEGIAAGAFASGDFLA